MNFQTPSKKDEDEETERLIQPITQKLFSFNEQTVSNFDKLRNLKHFRNDYKPVIQSKKLNSDPKLILSMERKKMRILNSIRGCQIQQPPLSTKKMSGKKINVDRIYSRLNKRQNKLYWSQNEDFFEKQDNEGKNNKKKNNPYMNFSLLYLQERKKKRKMQNEEEESRKRKIEEKQRPLTSRTQTNRPTTSRGKGSEGSYVDCIINQTMMNKKREFELRSKSAKGYRSSFY